MTASPEKPLRRDAERNRQRLLDAARELFAERGLNVTLDEIAHHAGVGVGTAYRRFGSRDALVTALFEQRMSEIVALAEDALKVDDPWRALQQLIERVLEMQAADRGLKELLLGSRQALQQVSQIRDRMRPRGEELVRRAQAAGVLRKDFSAQDLPLLQMMLSAIIEVSPPERADLWRRYMALLLDGMRAEGVPRSPLPVPPVEPEALDEVMTRWRPPRPR
jgi:AcrR family transcriptional regulator